ncbi:hypothetical protein [Burkholderia cenocepacia]|uniref:hypothetical protein n=1 Tax=Burkholderia cenocepacia TaxID=95486 RepID=UPI000761B576|nr:hypothetical protein [Burkholderia cenocepacia]KWU26410.1 hypothetical protein AS149_25825 [Burkholderia cenocepacia]
MERHREIQLRQALDTLWRVGSVDIRWDEFYLWTGVQRIAKKPWRVVFQLWEELCVEQGYAEALPLTVLSLDHAVVFRREPFAHENTNLLSDLT